MQKYRLKSFDMKNDMWVIQKRFWIFWRNLYDYGVGSHGTMEDIRIRLIRGDWQA